MVQCEGDVHGMNGPRYPPLRRRSQHSELLPKRCMRTAIIALRADLRISKNLKTSFSTANMIDDMISWYDFISTLREKVQNQKRAETKGKQPCVLQIPPRSAHAHMSRALRRWGRCKRRDLKRRGQPRRSVSTQYFHWSSLRISPLQGGKRHGDAPDSPRKNRTKWSFWTAKNIFA